MQAIFFDANGVLYYRVDKHGSMRAFLERHHLPVPLTEMVRQATAAVRERAFIGAISKATYYDTVLAAWGVTDPQLQAEGHRVQDTAQAAIILYAGVLETLPVLKARGFKLGIITNAVASTTDKLRWFHNSGLTVAWDAFANSVEVGATKPDPRMYLAALEQSSVAAADALFVGHKQSEISGAHALGMHTVAFNADPAVQAEYTVVRFTDLLNLPVLQTATLVR
jgi:HAD superfamily hydrolase (TIGR01509 family)